MEKYNVSEVSVLDLLPQRVPFVMVDKLEFFDSIKTVTSLVVRQDNIFVEDNVLSAYGLIENIAQTCAARMGYINYMEQNGIKLGFIGAVRDLNINRLPNVGEDVTTSIDVKEEVFNMTLVDAVVKSKDEILATVQMKIALSNIESKSA